MCQFQGVTRRPEKVILSTFDQFEGFPLEHQCADLTN